jgi:hypothetical protein
MAALQASGAISLQDIEEQYNPGSNLPSRGLNEFYLGGSLVRANAGNNSSTNMSAGVPTSGAISFNNFYSKERAFRKTYSSNATNQSADTIFGDDFEVDYPKQFVVNASQTVGSTNPSNAALTIESNGVGSITVTNNGSIEGAGGAANGGTGGNALEVAGSVAVTLVNNGTIKAGGGGGGAGGAGGAGSASATATISSVTDKVGNKPTFVPYSVKTQFVSARAWSGIGSGQWGLNTSGNPVTSNISDRGPVWYSFKVDKSAEYSLSSYITDPYPEDGHTGHRGQPRVDISTSENTASQGQGGNLYGSGLSWSGVKAPLSANTLYYFCNYTVGPYTFTAGGDGVASNFYYNDMNARISLTVNEPTSGGSAGAGGVGQGYNQSAGSAGSGGSGGTNAGSGGNGGAGGAFGAAGSSGSVGGNGTGDTISYPSTAPTNGSSGSSGGSSGKSIQGVSNVTSSGSGSLTGGTA